MIRTIALISALTLAPFVATAAEEKEGGKPVYVEQTPYLITVIKGGTIRGQLIVGAQYGVTKKEDEEKVKLLEPRLRDASIRSLSSFASRSVTPGRPVDTPGAALALQRAADSVLGPGVVKVYLKAASFRRM